jgi:hypothetical protein
MYMATEKTIDCSDLIGTYTLDEAKELVNTINKRIVQAMKQDAAEEDNDLAYMGKMKKAIRHANVARIHEEGIIEKLLAKGIDVEEHDEGTRLVISPVGSSRITFYPKSNKCQIHEDNVWVQGALMFIKKRYKI